MFSTLVDDFRIIFERDPAARNWLEVLICYQGFQAIFCYRIAHWIDKAEIAFLPRFISYLTRFVTGIEIHPKAHIGKGVFIDHGTGIVIGETAIIGEYSLIYQGVTLGGTGKEKGKRHPTLGKNVVVGCGAKLLGNIRIGDNVRIGAGSVVLHDVPSNCTIVGIPGKVVCRSGAKFKPLEHSNLPDSKAILIDTLSDRIESLEQEIKKISQKESQSESLVQSNIIKS